MTCKICNLYEKYGLEIVFLFSALFVFLSWYVLESIGFRIFIGITYSILSCLLTYKDQKAENKGINYTSWFFTISLIILYLTYILALFKSAFPVIAILLISVAIIAVAYIIVMLRLHIIRLITTDNFWNLILFYLIITVVIIIIFASFYQFSNQGNELRWNNQTLEDKVDYALFSGMIYYSIYSGYLGTIDMIDINEVILIIEVGLSVIFHIIILAVAIQKFDRKFFEKLRKK